MVGLVFGVEQFSAAHQPLRGLFTHLGFGSVGQARGHGPRRHKHGGQMAKMQGADQEAGNNFVAHAEHQRRVIHVVAERDRCGHGDHVAAEEAHLHARGALRHAVAHGRHTACHLGRGTSQTRFVFDDVRVMLQRRVCRKHVVVGVDDGDVGRALRDDSQLVVRWQGGDGVGHVGAAQTITSARAASGGVKALQVGGTRGGASICNPLGDFIDR